MAGRIAESDINNSLSSSKGRQFDPLTVDVFVDMLSEGQLEAAQTQAQ